MSSKILSEVIIGAILLAGLASTLYGISSPESQAGFIPISVLAEDQADYGVDEVQQMIPSISLEIIGDKLQDEGNTESSLPVIFFSSGAASDQDQENTNTQEDLGGDRGKDQVKDNGNSEVGNNAGNENGSGAGNGNGAGAGNGAGQGQGNENSQEKGENGKGKPQTGNHDNSKGNTKKDNGKGKP